VANAQKSVNCDVSHPRHQVIFNRYSKIFMVLIHVPLQVVETKRVAFFVLCIAITFDLQTLVGQMDKIVFVPKVIIA
jgi:hypothetical protein